jgi:3-isopropylmalate dehydrogenase
MRFNIAVIGGDGIGPEIISECKKVLDKVGQLQGHEFIYDEILAGGAAIDAVGNPLPESAVQACLKSDSVLLGAVGGPKWDHLPGSDRPEQAILGLRKKLGLYANLRPALLFSELSQASPLRADIVEKGLDFIVVRELTGGIYFGEKATREGENGLVAYDVEIYSEEEIARIAEIAFKTAMKRRRRLTSVDKANVLESSRLWRRVVNRMSDHYPLVKLSHMYIDNAAMQLIREPGQFDVIVTSNMFGDILSDEAAMITGSIGMQPSSSLGRNKPGIYEPIHGSAPDIAGKDMANPMGAILSCAMMLRDSFDLPKEALAVEKSVNSVLKEGYRTADIMSPGKKQIGTRETGDRITDAVCRIAT